MDFPIIPVVDIDIPFVNPQAKALDIERFSASTLIFLFGLQEPLTSYVLPVNGLYSAKMRTATTSRTHGPSPGSHRGVESRVKFDKTILSGTWNARRSQLARLARSLPGLQGFVDTQGSSYGKIHISSGSSWATQGPMNMVRPKAAARQYEWGAHTVKGIWTSWSLLGHGSSNMWFTFIRWKQSPASKGTYYAWKQEGYGPRRFYTIEEFSTRHEIRSVDGLMVEYHLSANSSSMHWLRPHWVLHMFRWTENSFKKILYGAGPERKEIQPCLDGDCEAGNCWYVQRLRHICDTFSFVRYIVNSRI